jgi:Zn-dependent protease
MNLLIFFILGIFIRPKFGWINYALPVNEWTNPQIFVSALAYLQLFCVLLNLVPIPGIDGFGIISPWLPADIRARVTAPHLRMVFMMVYFMMLWQSPLRGYIDAAMSTFAEHTLGVQIRSGYDSFVLAARGTQ